MGIAEDFRQGLLDGIQQKAADIRELNEKLMLHLDRHHTIGHAFFMQQNMSASKITQVWKRKVFPLIEEFFFDRPEILDEYSLEKFWPSTQRNA